MVLLFLGWLIAICYSIVSVETQSNGLFFQKRIGRYGKKFTILKLKTIHPKTGIVTFFGAFFRKYKIDELPQFWNVLISEMSVVGPRPDIPGYYDQLVGEQRKILELKPGITSEASLKYSKEDEVLRVQKNPLKYNDSIIFPDKVKMNLHYYYTQSFWGDLNIILKTLF